MKHKNLLQTIGNTPLVELNKIIKNPKIKVFAKLEGQNPGGSIKDRVALYMIEKAEKKGELNKRKTILEATSGNMGIALATVGAYKGYKVEIIMSEGMSEERKMMLRSLGAKLTLTDKKLGTGGAIAKAKELAKKYPKKYWFANQFNNTDNSLAHYYGLAPELLKELPKIDYIVAGVGTSGTIMGLSKRFRKDSPRTQIIEVWPPEGYKIQGLQNPQKDFIGDIYQNKSSDTLVKVSTKNAFAMAKKLATQEGIFAGMSSGAIVYTAQQLSKKIKSGNIVVIIPDRGEKYLSTDLFK